MKYKKEIPIFSGFILLGLIVTYPLIFKMKSSIYGQPGDSLSMIYGFWWWKYAWMNHLPVNKIIFLGAPLGLKVTTFLTWALYTIYTGTLLSFLTNEIFTYNFFTLLSFPLSAITMYFLVYHFTKNRLAAVVSGTIYSFSPYHFSHIQHLSLMQTEWMPLYALFLFKLSEERNYKNAILCGFLFSVVALETFYYGYFMLIFTGTFILWQGWRGLRRKGVPSRQAVKPAGNSVSRLKNQGLPHRPGKTFLLVLVAAAVALAITLPPTYNIFKAAFVSSPGKSMAEGGLSRPFEDLFMYSARPLGYLLPSPDHPIFGKYTKNFVKTPFYGDHPTEQTLYLGWVGIILAIVAIRQWRKNNREERGVSFFLFAGITALLFSLKPYLELGELRILLPSYFTYKIIPTVRVLARFGIVVLLSASVLAGMGLAFVLERISTPKRKGIFLALILSLVFFEFTNIPPFRTTDISVVPPVYKWLGEQPGDFIVAEYPLRTDLRYLFWQRIHQKPLINGAVPGTAAEEIRKSIIDITAPETPGILARLGAKYVIFHPDRYLGEEKATRVIGEVPDMSRVAGLRFVGEFKGVQVYEIVAEGRRTGD